MWLVVDVRAEARLERLGPSAQVVLVVGWLLTWLWRLRAPTAVSQPDR